MDYRDKCQKIKFSTSPEVKWPTGKSPDSPDYPPRAWSQMHACLSLVPLSSHSVTYTHTHTHTQPHTHTSIHTHTHTHTRTHTQPAAQTALHTLLSLFTKNLCLKLMYCFNTHSHYSLLSY